MSVVQQGRAPRGEQQRSTETKTAILDAALSEFANYGYEGASARGIGERAGVKHTLITHHFGGKEALWKATAARLFEVYAERIRSRQQGLEGVDEAILVRLILREFILYSRDVPEFHRFMMHANQAGGERLAWLVQRFLVPGSTVEAGFLKRAQAAGVFPAGDTVHLRYLFVGAATSIFTFAAEFEQISGRDPFSEEVLDAHVELLARLFRSHDENIGGKLDE